MPIINQLASSVTKRLSEDIIGLVEATPADKQTWKPLGEGRSVLEILVEVAGTNLYAAKLLATRELPAWWDDDAHAKFAADNDTVPKAVATLRSSVDALTRAIDRFPATSWDDKVALPWDGGMSRSYNEVALLGFSHMTYHQGQIAYIQTLYGDKN
jgi:uncharacterized damage-inducible protein DinB